MPRIPVAISGSRRAHLRWHPLLGALLLLVGLVCYMAPASRAQDSAGPVFVVQVRDEIDLGLAPYLARVLQQAERESARAVILEIDTPGGRLDAVLQMRDAILASPVRTIAFVNRTAFSAGALVALASNELYLAPGAVIGAATPVTRTGAAVDEKVISAVRTTFKATAELRGRNPAVAEAMVDPSIEIAGLISRGQLLTLTTTEAQAWGYADGVVADRQELLSAAGLSGAAVHQTSPSLAETAVRVLTIPAVASLLIALGLLLIVLDLLTGGFGLAGGTGLGLLALFFWGHLLAGLAGWEGVVLVLLGLLLLGLEAFVVPGSGVTGVLGAAALTVGLFMSLIGGQIVSSGDVLRAGATLGSALVMTVAGVALLLRLLYPTARFEGLVLQERLAASDGRPRLPHGKWPTRPSSVGAASAKAQRGVVETASLVGAQGVALSDLRPAGFARIRGEPVDVVTQGGYVMAGEGIEVVSDEGYRRVVRRLAPEEGDAPWLRSTHTS